MRTFTGAAARKSHEDGIGAMQACSGSGAVVDLEDCCHMTLCESVSPAGRGAPTRPKSVCQKHRTVRGAVCSKSEVGGKLGKESHHWMGLLEQFFRKVIYSWVVEDCPGYIFSVIEIFLPDSWEKISSGDPLLPGQTKRAWFDLDRAGHG